MPVSVVADKCVHENVDIEDINVSRKRVTFYSKG